MEPGVLVSIRGLWINKFIGSRMTDSVVATKRQGSPDEELAVLIANRLLKAGLITERAVSDVTARLADGAAREEDWQKWIKQAIDRRAKDGVDGKA